MKKHYVVLYATDPEKVYADLDAIAIHRKLFSTEGRAVGSPNRSATVLKLIEEELVRMDLAGVKREHEFNRAAIHAAYMQANRDRVAAVIASHGGDKNAAAAELGISRSRVYEILKSK